jgi:hypothetical protein
MGWGGIVARQGKMVTCDFERLCVASLPSKMTVSVQTLEHGPSTGLHTRAFANCNSLISNNLASHTL